MVSSQHRGFLERQRETAVTNTIVTVVVYVLGGEMGGYKYDDATTSRHQSLKKRNGNTNINV